MNYQNNQNQNQFDPETVEKIYHKVSSNNELAQSVYNLFYQIFEKNPGEKFTRFAKKEFRDGNDYKQKEQLRNSDSSRQIQESKAVEPTLSVPSDATESKTHLQKKKIGLQLSKPWEKPVSKKEEFVLDNHRKVIEKFKETFAMIKPNPKLVQFQDVPILDLNQKPTIEEHEFFRPRKSSFNKIS